MPRVRNDRLAAVLAEAGWSQEQTAARCRSVAAESAATNTVHLTRSHVSQWVLGSQPGPLAARILCETLSRAVQRTLTPKEIGLTASSRQPDGSAWDVDTLAALVDLGGANMTDLSRRTLLTYSATGAVLPPETWWHNALERGQARRPLGGRTATAAHVEALREAMGFFSRQDQRLGGRAGHDALLAYLRTDVADYLGARFPNEALRRQLFTAAAELVYLTGWTSFDSNDHGTAQHAFRLAARMAAEADDAPLAGHILRAAAHQEVDLHHPARALQLAEGSLAQRRYTLAGPREKALLGVVHARALAATSRKTDARAALRRAANDLADATGGDAEPARVFFFAEASLAHESACTLRDLGELAAAEAEFHRSVRTRGAAFARTGVVTLGYLGDVQALQGKVEEACSTWHQALDAVGAIQSGRVKDTVIRMRRVLAPLRIRGAAVARELDDRARDVLLSVG